MNFKNDPHHIWVSSHNNGQGEGSFEHPYASVAKAIECALPGQTVVLKSGIYTGNVTISNGGAIDKPLRIMAQEDGLVQWRESCWYFYDVSDIICSGIVFKDSPDMAMAVMGKCERNRFERMKFVNCSFMKENACTFFFGGSGQACNVVESCEFEGPADIPAMQDKTAGVPVGILIAEGDFQGGEPNRDFIISKNSVTRYGYGILVGSQDSTLDEYGHQVTYNKIEHCIAEGIMAKCGDTLVKGNNIRYCAHSISLAAGTGSIVEDNRILDCEKGIRVAGIGHTVSNNCIIRCLGGAISVLSGSMPQSPAASNAVIEHNTMIDWDDNGVSNATAILIEPGTSSVIRKNLFCGKGRPYAVVGQAVNKKAKQALISLSKTLLVKDNAVCGLGEPLDGAVSATVSFVSAPLDNYTNDSGYGARGWMLSPEAYEPGPDVEPVCMPEYANADSEPREDDGEGFDNAEDVVDGVVSSMFMQDDENFME